MIIIHHHTPSLACPVITVSNKGEWLETIRLVGHSNDDIGQRIMLRLCGMHDVVSREGASFTATEQHNARTMQHLALTACMRQMFTIDADEELLMGVYNMPVCYGDEDTYIVATYDKTAFAFSLTTPTVWLHDEGGPA